MNLWGAGHHWQPFDEDPADLERHQLIERANDLAAEVHRLADACRDKDRTITELRGQVARLQAWQP